MSKSKENTSCCCTDGITNLGQPAIENYINPLTELKRRVENGEKNGDVAAELGIIKKRGKYHKYLNRKRK